MAPDWGMCNCALITVTLGNFNFEGKGQIEMSTALIIEVPQKTKKMLSNIKVFRFSLSTWLGCSRLVRTWFNHLMTSYYFLGRTDQKWSSANSSWWREAGTTQNGTFLFRWINILVNAIYLDFFSFSVPLRWDFSLNFSLRGWKMLFFKICRTKWIKISK